MVKPEYTAGFRFVVSTPAQTLDKHDRKAIRSHATRAGRRQDVQLRSWICPNRELRSLKQAILDRARITEAASSVSIPSRIGSDLSGLQLPSGFEPYMIQDLLKLIDLNKYGVYPYEICLHVHLVERGWFPYMVSDVCCLHSMMFSVRAFVENTLHDRLSYLACFHYAQTLRILEARLNELDQTSAISDSTIMVVITLAQAAEITEDIAALANHMKGLEKIVALRGGVRALSTHHNMQVKVCRADLSYALQFGHRPRLLKGVPWDCFIADHGLIHCAHQPYDTKVRAFAEAAFDARLHNVLRDLHAFSCISNLAYQTTRKLSPEIYNEMVISVLYRLTLLSFETDAIQEAIRVGLLAFSSTIFIQRYFMEQPYEHLLNLYSNSLLKLRTSTDVELPVPILFWLTMLSQVVPHKDDSADRQSLWLDEAILRAGIDSWPQAREILRSVAWVNFVHDPAGKQAFEAVMLRLARPGRLNI